MHSIKHFANVTALLAVITGAGTAEARDRPGTPTDPRVILAGPTEVDIYFRNTAGGVLVVFPLEIKLDGKRLHPDIERSVSQEVFSGGMYGNGELTLRITSELLGGRLGPGIEFCFRAWSRTRVRNETYFTASDDVFSEIPSSWACGVPLPNKPPQPTQVISEYRACLDAGSQCRPGFKDRAVLVRWLIPTFPYGTTIDRVAVEKKRYLPDVTDWAVDFSKEYVIRHAMKQPQYDGEFLAPPKQDGKYMYRVCLENAAGRECGVANLSLVVENPRIQGTARTPGVAVAEAAAPRTTTPVEELKNPNTARAQAAATSAVAVAEASETRGSSSRVDPSAPVTLNPQPLPPKAVDQATQTRAVAANPQQASQQAMVNPGSNVALNPQPLPPKTTVLKTRETTVLPSGPMQTRDATTRNANPQTQVKGTAMAGGVQAAQILCRGGKSIGLEQMSEETARALGRKQSGATYSLYFGTTEGTVIADGNGLHASTCAFLGQPWKPGDPPGIRFDADPAGAFFYNEAPRAGEETKSRRHYLDRPDHYWLFTVKAGHGFYEAVSHDIWEPALGTKAAAAGVAIDAKTKVPQGATAASPEERKQNLAAQIPTNLFGLDDRAIIIVGGMQLHAGQIKQELRAGVQRASGTPAVLTLRKQLTANYASSSTPIAGQSSAPASQLARATQSRAAAASALASTPISGTSDQLQRASSLQVDCDQQQPRILAVHGALTPGANVRLEGTCFGERGAIELRGEFGAQGTLLRLSSSRWTSNAVEFLTPALSGTRDHAAILTLTRTDGVRSPDKSLPFSAKRRTVVVPGHKWSPRSNPEYSQIEEASSGAFLGAPDVSAGAPGPFTLQATVGVSPDCALDEVSATSRAGRVRAIEGWDRPGPSNVGSVSVNGEPICATRVDQYDFGIYGHTDARRVCSLAIDLTATAACPEGIEP